MELWQINLLGPPCVLRNGQEKRPQAKETWAVLAALVLPTPVGAHTPQPQRRQALAERFWADKDDPRVHLRQSLTYLTKLFGEDCFRADRETVQVVAGRFVTDIEQMLTAYREALASDLLEERLRLLAEATSFIRGDFLEGCLQPGDCGESWMLRLRAEIRGVVVRILTASMETLTVAEMFPAAIEVACRLLEWQPDHKQVRERMRELLDKTGRTALNYESGATADFPELMERLRTKPGNHITMTEMHLFTVGFKAEMQALPLRSHTAFLRLSVFPAPFSAEMAQAVCGVSASKLRILAKTPLLESRADGYALPDIVQAATWRQVPATTRQHLHKRLSGLCEGWVRRAARPPSTLLPPFTSTAQAEPFLQAALAWNLRQPPNYDRISFVCNMHQLGLLPPGGAAPAYLEYACRHETLPIEWRRVAGLHAGTIYLDRGEYPQAIYAFEQTLDLFASEPENPYVPRMHFYLSLAFHYGGNSQASLAHLGQAKAHYLRHGGHVDLGQCLRFQCEVQASQGNNEEALTACEEAVQIRREFGQGRDSVADALYWKGVLLWKLGRPGEASDCFEEALSSWQETNDTTGIAFCLRMMGRLRSAEGRFAEARAHLEHAILLHERKEDPGSRIAAVAALADNYSAEGRLTKASTLYMECLAYSETQQDSESADRFRARVQDCSQ